MPGTAEDVAVVVVAVSFGRPATGVIVVVLEVGVTSLKRKN